MDSIKIEAYENAIQLEGLGRPIPENHKYFDTPHTIMMLGPKRCGKTSLIKNFLLRPELYYQHFRNIFVIAPVPDIFDECGLNKERIFTSYSPEKLAAIKAHAISTFEDPEDQEKHY